MINNSAYSNQGIRIFRILENIPVGIITFDSAGRIDFVNTAFTRLNILYHLNVPSLVGSDISGKNIFPGVSINENLEDLKQGYPFERELKNLKTADGYEISLIVKGVPVFEHDIYAGGILVVEDIKVVSDAHSGALVNLSQLQNIFKSLTDLLFIIDKNGFVKYSAGKKLNLLDIKGKEGEFKLTDLIPDLPLFPDFILNVLNSGEEREFELKLYLGEKPAVYKCTVSPIVQDNGESRLLICSFTDISVLKSLRDEIERLRIFESAARIITDAVFVFDYEGRIILCNSSFEKLTGMSSAEAAGKFLNDIFPGFVYESFTRLKYELAESKFLQQETSVKNIKGDVIPLNVSFLLNENVELITAVCTGIKEEEDVADLKTPDELAEFVSSDVIIIKLSSEGNIEHINSAFTKPLGYNREEVLGKKLSEIADGGIIKEQMLNLTELAEAPSKKVELSVLSKKNEPVYLAGNYIVSYSGGSPAGITLYLFDISENKKAQKDSAIFKSLFLDSNEGMAIESNGRIVHANEAFAKLFGYDSAKNLTGKELLDLTATADILRMAEYIELKHAGKDAARRFEFTAKRKDNTTFFCELTVSIFREENKSSLALIARDVTERKQAQKIIRESEEKYRNLIESIDDFLYTFERAGNFFKPSFFTSSVFKITGFTQKDMMSDSKLIFKIIYPDDFPVLKDSLRKIIKSKVKESDEFEFRIINKQGNIVWVRNKINIVRNEQGEVQRFYGLVSDITLRKKAEEDLKKSTENLIKLNETKDRFISIISHDLRTPFSSILGFTDLLLNDETLTGEERNQYVRYIQESSNSMLTLVNSLLDWTRLQTGRISFEPEKVEADDIIEKSINALSGAAFQKDIKILSSVPKDTFVYADKNLIGQVFNNLISNAIKFTEPGGEIIISAGPSERARFIEFSVKDSGLGIKPEDLEKLFGVDTKFTTEGTAGEKGTGLGLSLVKEIIERHGGTIKVESEYGKSTDFRFILPLSAANILLVDPSPTDRILYSKILKHIAPDYLIETASNGADAFRKLSDAPYALVITEHNMPSMGGYDFVLELKKSELKVKPPVIILSSRIDRQTIEDYSNIGVENVFNKPVDLITFKKAVEKSLTKVPG